MPCACALWPASLTKAAAIPLSAGQLIDSAAGNYWQFTAHTKPNQPLNAYSVYVAQVQVPALRALLAERIRWFQPHGLTRASAVDVSSLCESLSAIVRMPDERSDAPAYASLLAWLQSQDDADIWIQQLVFRAPGTVL